MAVLPAFVVVMLIAALLVSAALPTRFASAPFIRSGAWLRLATTALLGASLAAGPWLGLQSRPLLQAPIGDASIDLLYWNGLAWLMLALVSFIGWIVARFSRRQLDGDPGGATYYRHVALTLGGILLAVVAGNLLLMLAGWLAANFGLRRLLAYYQEHPGAQEGARMKYAVDQLGAALLVGAVVLISQTYGTLNLAALAQVDASAAADAAAAGLVAWLLVFAAAVISVQFPFHFWLPEALATPTPVSALMHAGIVNAGGYFLIRLSGLLVAAPSALTMLAAAGAATLLLGGFAMLAQSSVKKTLAFSTVAQMGLMMLQCGLGAWTAAMLHIVAHSLYKAYAFLASGDVLVTAQAVKPLHGEASAQQLPAAVRLAVAVAIVATCYLAVATATGLSPLAKPGGFLLGAVLCIALVRRTWVLLQGNLLRMAAVSAVTTLGLCLVYSFAYLAIDAVVAGSTIAWAPAPVQTVLSLGVGAALAALLAWELAVDRRPSGRVATAFYVHALNGFYVDAAARRVLRSVST